MKLTNVELQELYRTLNEGSYNLKDVVEIDDFFKEIDNIVVGFENETNLIIEGSADEQKTIYEDKDIADENKHQMYLDIKDKYQKKWDELSKKEIEVNFDVDKILEILSHGSYPVKGRRGVIIFREMIEKWI